MIYFVSQTGSDNFTGTSDKPFRTINHAAQIAMPGDTVKIFGGVYREWVAPKNSGTEQNPIVYESANDERPVILGSEVVTDWEKVCGGVYKKVLNNSFFGDFNPFATPLFGDWLQQPDTYQLHLGDVYVNGKSMYEATDLDALKEAKRRDKWFKHVLTPEDEYLLRPEDSVYQWYAEVDSEKTTIYANFQQLNPNENTVEINVRPTCFTPKTTGVNYITVRGLEMARAATQLAPPTANQVGIIGPNWAKGWVIENNIFHDSKCSGVCLGKEASTGDNYSSKYGRKSGHCYQFEAVFNGLRAGWSKENIGSHTVRNNTIYDCGQTGIVGHMGCAFSLIEHNHIYNIGIKHEFLASEMAGIKFHAPIDTVIKNNNIHNCTLGTWLDWQVQGVRVTGNLYYDNDRDFHIEVTHGPCTVDNNVFLSKFFMDNQAQGTAFVHNLIVGAVRLRNELQRVTPYHVTHSTEVAGAVPVYGGDDRILNNLILGKTAGVETPFGNTGNLSDVYDSNTLPDEFNDKLIESGLKVFNFRRYLAVTQPVWISGNAYSGFAKPHRAEPDAPVAEGMTAKVERVGNEWILTLSVCESVCNMSSGNVTTEALGSPRIPGGSYENPDGTPIDFTLDFHGNLRPSKVIAGPFAALLPGEQRITVWKI